MLNKIKKYFKKELKIIPPEIEERTLSDICKCTGEIPIENLTDYITLGLVTGQHTGTIIQKCLKCNCLRGFPNSNLLLAINKGDEDTLYFLNTLNNRL